MKKRLKKIFNIIWHVLVAIAFCGFIALPFLHNAINKTIGQWIWYPSLAIFLVYSFIPNKKMKEQSKFVQISSSGGILVHFDWNKLIEPFRKKLGLTKRTIIDNPTIAQYYLNESKTEVTAFKQEVSQAFHTDKFQYKHELLAKMPIRNYWTTNYDPIIENAELLQLMDDEKEYN